MGIILPPLVTARWSPPATASTDEKDTAERHATPDNSAPQDQVTLSGDGSSATVAEEAGLFQVNWVVRPAAATSIPVTAQADNARPVDPPTPVSLRPFTAGVNAPPAAPAATPEKPAPKVNSPPPAEAVPAEGASQLYSLDDSLRAQGLNASQIREINQLASFRGVYNPAAYIALIQELEQQSQIESAQPAAEGQPTEPGSTPSEARGQNPQPATLSTGPSVLF